MTLKLSAADVVKLRVEFKLIVAEINQNLSVYDNLIYQFIFKQSFILFISLIKKMIEVYKINKPKSKF